MDELEQAGMLREDLLHTLGSSLEITLIEKDALPDVSNYTSLSLPGGFD